MPTRRADWIGATVIPGRLAAIIIGSFATLVLAWPHDSHGQQAADFFKDMRLRPAIASHGVRTRQAVSAQFPALRSPDLKDLSKDVAGLSRTQAALRSAMAAARELQSRHPDLLKEELAKDRPAFRADIANLGADDTTADQVASTIDATIIAGAINSAANNDADLITLLESELDYTDFLLSRQTAWHVQADGSLIFDSSADLKDYQAILARIDAALAPMAGGR